jgi:cell division protein FtsB
LRELEDTNAALEARIAALGTDQELERLARQDLNMVKPGEIAYTVLPPAAFTTLPDGVPFDMIRAWLTAP